MCEREEEGEKDVYKEIEVRENGGKKKGVDCCKGVI